MKVVIVGGVAGGASAAARLRRLDEQAEIILLERGGYISYANCGLPYYIGGEITDKEALTLQTPESFHQRFRVDVRVGHNATKIDPQAKSVEVHPQGGQPYTESYDKLILSPGAEPIRPAMEGVEDPRIFTLRTIPDTFAIKAYMDEKKPRRAVVVGGGFIGLEMAENLAAQGLAVTVVEMADHLVAPLDYDIACDLHHYLRGKGVALRLGSGVKGFALAADCLEVKLEGESLPADLVVLSIGVRPDTALAKAAGLDCNDRGGIRVNSRMETSRPHIYAVGDAVEITNLVTGNQGMVPLAGPANKQGRIAADNICGIPSEYKGTQGSAVLKVFDCTVAVTGLNEKAAAQAGIDYDKVYTLSASHATYYPGSSSISVKLLFEKGSGRVLGAQMVGQEGVDKRCDVVATAIRAGMTVHDLGELELCYAPPFSSAKDPVNMAGFVAENILSGQVKQVHWDQVDTLPRNGSVTLLDVRTDEEYARGHIQGTQHIPLDDLRDNLGKLDATKPVYVNCHSGLRSYLACRILTQKGFDCYNLAGGYRLYASIMEEKSVVGKQHRPCGAE